MNFRLRHLAFFALVVLLAAVLVFPKPRERALWEKRGGDLGKIIERHRYSLKDRPEDILLTRELASFLIEATSFDEARVLLEGQIARGQEPEMAARVLGHMYENLGELRKASDLRGIVARSDPSNLVLLTFAVKRMMWLQDEGRVIELMQSALATGVSFNEELCQLLAKAYENTARLKDALVWRQKITTLKPRSLRAWLDLADVQQLLGNEEAELSIRRSIWEKTGDIDHGLFYARRLDEYGQVQALREFLAALLKARPDNIEIRRFVASSVIKSRDMESRAMVDDYIQRWGREDAEMRFEYAMWLHEVGEPSSPAAFESLLAEAGDKLSLDKKAMTLGALGRLQEAADLWETLLESYPVDARIELSYLYVKLGHPDLATRHARALWLLTPVMDRGLALADLLVVTNKSEEAFRVLAEIEAIHGFTQEVAAKRILLAVEAGRLNEATTLADELDKRSQLPATVLYVRSRILHESGNYSGAERLLGQAEIKGISSDAAMTTGQIALLRCLNVLAWKEAPKGLVDRLVIAQGEADPADVVVPYAHVQWLILAGYMEEADSKASTLLAMFDNPVHVDERIIRAKLLAITGRRTESLAMWETLRHDRPLESLEAMADIHEANGNIAEALAASSELLTLNRDRRHLRRHASLLVRVGRAGEASELLAHMMQKSPGDKELLLDALWVHLDAGLFTQVEPFLSVYEKAETGPAPALFRAAFSIRLGQASRAVEALLPLPASLLEEGVPAFGSARDVSYTASTALLGAKDDQTILFGMDVRSLVKRHLGLYPGDSTLALDVAALERENGHPEVAVEFLGSILSLMKGSTLDEARVGRARILSDLKRPEALEAWTELQNLFPEEALPALVRLHKEGGRWDEAVKKQEEFVLRYPSRDNKMELAFLLDDAGRKEESLAVWEGLLADNKGDAQAVRALAYALLDAQKTERALVILESYLADVTGDESMRLLQSRVLSDSGHPDAALVSLCSLPSLTLDASEWSETVRESESLHLILGVFLSQDPDGQEAAEAFEPFAVEALDLLPEEDAVWRYRYAVWVGERGRTEESEAMLGWILEGPAVSSDASDSALVRGLILVQLKRFDEALAIADSVMETRTIPALELRVAALRGMEDPAGALEVLEELISLEPTKPRKLERVGLLTEVARRLEAVDACEEIIEEYGPDKEAYASWIYLLVDINNYNAAHGVHREMRKNFPDDPLTRYLRASLLYEGGSVRPALERLQALRDEGKLPKDETLYPDTLLETGQWPAGLAIFVSRDTTENDRESDRVWWRRRELEEIYRPRIDGALTGLFGEGGERVYRGELMFSMFLHERLRGEIGTSRSKFSKDEAEPFHEVDVAVSDIWLLGDLRLTDRRYLQVQGTLDDAADGQGFWWRAQAWGRERRWGWKAFHEHDLVAKRLTNLVGVGGREQRTEGEISVPDPWNPFIYYAGLGRYSDTVDKKLNHATGTEDAGDGRLWWGSMRWEIQGLVPHRQAQWGLQYRFLSENYDPDSPGILNLAPFAERKRAHGLTFDGRALWDRTWEWQGYVSLGRDTALGENGWGTGHRLVWRSDEVWRIGAGFDFGSSQGDGDTGKFTTGRIDAQVKF